MAHIAIAVFRILGFLILILLLIFLIFLALVFFYPIRYSLLFSVNDPEGSSEILHLDPETDVYGEAKIRWLLGLVQVDARYDGEGHVQIKILGSRMMGWLSGFLKKDKGEAKKKPAKAESLSFEEKVEKILRRIEKTWNRLEYSIDLMYTDYGCRARETIIKRIVPPFMSLLPREWGLTGVVGLGDPARSAKVFSLQGLLYPYIVGHVSVGTEYELYRYDLKGAARGSVRICSFVHASMRLLLDRDVRHLLKMVLRGPDPSHIKGMKKRKHKINHKAA